MAGDWIKIEHSLPFKPEVMSLATLLGMDDMAVVGHLICFWSWVDQNMSPECPDVKGTKKGLDRVAGRDGFVDAMVSVGWLKFDGEIVTVPNYEYHLSESAKKRAVEARKKFNQRKRHPKCPADKGTSTGHDGGPEERREESNKKKKKDDTIEVHHNEITIPANVDTDQCKESMGRLFAAINKRRVDGGEYNLDDFAIQANWNIAGQIGPEKLAAVVERGISRGWRSLVIPGDLVGKPTKGGQHKDSVECTPDEEILWAQIAAACKDTTPEGDKSRKAFDKLTKDIMTQIGGSAAIRDLNLGEAPEREMKKRFVLTRRQRMILEQVAGSVSK